MKAYKNYIIIIIVLLVVYLALAIPPLFEKRDKPRKMFNQLDKNEITKLVIEPSQKNKDNNPVKLIKEGGKWYVEYKNRKFDADQSKIDRLLSAITDLTSVRVVTKNMKDLKIYHLDKNNEYKLNVYLGNNLFSTICIGKTARDFRSTFFKLANENIVRVSPESLISYVRGSSSDWIDHLIFTLDVSRIDHINLPKVALYKKKNTWHFSDTNKIKVDDQKVMAYLNIFSKFRTNNFEFDKTKKECGLDKPELVIKLSEPNNIYEIYKGNEDKNWVYVMVKVNHRELPMIYKFYKNRLNALLKDPKYFVLEEKDSKLLDKK